MKDFITSFASTAGIQMANILTGILAARLLLPEGRGELALLFLWPVLVAELGAISINTSVGFHSARSTHDPQKIWSSTVILIAALSPVLMAVFIILAPAILHDQRAQVTELAWMAAWIIPLHLYSSALISQFQGMQDFSAYNLLRSLFHFCYLAFVCVLLLTAGSTLEIFLFSLVAANALPVSVAIWLAWRRGWINLRPAFDTIRDLVMYGLRAHVSAVLSIANRRLDQAIISVALAATDLGLYVIAMTIEGLLILIAATIDLLLFPKISAQQDERGRQEVLGRYFRATLLLCLPAAIFLLAFTPQLIELVFGPAFLSATDVARILIITGLPMAARILLATYMRGSNRMRIVTKSEGLGILVTIASLAILLPLYGLVGAALAQLIAFTLPTFYLAWMIRKDTDLSLLGLFRFQRRDMEVAREMLAHFRKKEGA